MNYIDKEALENFMQKFVDEDNDTPQTYCDAAMQCVKEFLNYDPELQQYTQTIKGDNGGLLALKAMPIQSITAFSVDGVSHQTSELSVVSDNYVEFEDGSLFLKGHKYSVTYTAGFSTVPELIKTTALQIASLFWESAGGNLAVSSTSFADTGSRVFNNFKADRFLEQIVSYKRMF